MFEPWIESRDADSEVIEKSRRTASIVPFTSQSDTRHHHDGPERSPHCYRTVWISDIHLGTRGCKAEYLRHFLCHVRADTLYLVGDIIDGWSLRRAWYWNDSHSAVIRAVLNLARTGTRVIYVPGNHDEMLRDYTGTTLAGISVVPEAIHRTVDGRRLLVIHGDEFDGVVTCARWLALLGDYAYQVALAVNHWFNRVRRRLGYPYWSLSAYLKGQVKNAVEFICQFEQAVAREARRRGVDGVVCGHIHCAEPRHIGGIEYCNDGDWVESCTALVEHADGRLEILVWPQQVEIMAQAGAAAEAG